jgi:hypothetical protein
MRYSLWNRDNVWCLHGHTISIVVTAYCFVVGTCAQYSYCKKVQPCWKIFNISQTEKKRIEAFMSRWFCLLWYELAEKCFSLAFVGRMVEGNCLTYLGERGRWEAINAWLKVFIMFKLIFLKPNVDYEKERQNKKGIAYVRFLASMQRLDWRSSTRVPRSVSRRQEVSNTRTFM